VLPNVLAPVIVVATLGSATAIMIESIWFGNAAPSLLLGTDDQRRTEVHQDLYLFLTVSRSHDYGDGLFVERPWRRTARCLGSKVKNLR
jgi:hypothetical protein